MRLRATRKSLALAGNQTTTPRLSSHYND